MAAPSLTQWLNQLLAVLQWLQHAVLQTLYWLTGTTTEFDQPAWLLPQRIAGEVLMIDHGLARQVLYSLFALAVILALLVRFLIWHQGRQPVAAMALLVVLITPWPSPSLILTTAYPGSFHTSPETFSAVSIELGHGLYQQHCMACHGQDGRGMGEQAPWLPRYPPDLSSPLLGHRADGELAWHILYGMRDHAGVVTMPPFIGTITPDETWALLNYMKALGAGEGSQRNGNWPIPVPLPDFAVRCGDQLPIMLSVLQGQQQRIRLVATGSDRDHELQESPLLTTIMLTPSGHSITQPQMQCWAHDNAAWNSLALIAGRTPQNFAGTQLLADRQGWLRARTLGIWSQDDFLCVSANDTTTDAQAKPTNDMAASAIVQDGLFDLIERMDNEPVRYIKGGFVH